MTTTDDPIKQWIVMRTDLNMRKGKMVAQGSHASISFLTKNARTGRTKGYHAVKSHMLVADVTPQALKWINEGFTKVCVGIDSQKGLFDIYHQAQQAGLEVHVIIDSGKTEFDGKPTPTCLAIGPDHASKVNPITGNLKLL